MKKLPAVCLLAGLAWGTAGCAPAPEASAPAGPAWPRPAADEFAVMTFNLNQYALAPPAGEADTLEPRPRAAAAALFAIIGQVAPDILAVQEMGDPAAWADFQYRLRETGLDYRYGEYLRHDPQDLNLAVLSRFPIVARRPHTDDSYTIGPTQFPVRRGFLDVELEINPAYRLRLLVAHLKSKQFHEYGQAEMRRNEARLLNNHVRAALKENPGVNLLVAGDFNDDPASRVLREIHTYQDQPQLFDLRPIDANGDAWTQRTADDTHLRSDYLLVNEGLRSEVVLDKCFVVRSPLLPPATDHCPLVGVFAAAERGPESAPDLSRRQPPALPQND